MLILGVDYLGYAFLLFQEENSVHKLVLACVSEGDKMFTYINYMSATGPVRKKVSWLQAIVTPSTGCNRVGCLMVLTCHLHLNQCTLSSTCPHQHDSAYSVCTQVQIKPWRIADSCHTSGSGQSIDCRKAVFVGGVPRPLRACELAEVMTDREVSNSFIWLVTVTSSKCAGELVTIMDSTYPMQQKS